MDTILVLDFGGQYAHLIANRLRRLGVYAEIEQSDCPLSKLKKAKGVILSGGPNSVYEKTAPKFNKGLFSLKVPVLGICYGHQLMAYAMKGAVKTGKVKEYGFAKVGIKKCAIFKGLRSKETVWMSHGDSVAEVPDGFTITAGTPDCPIAGMADEKRNYYGVQFHPEVTHTMRGMKILKNFLKLTGAKRSWGMKRYLQDIRKEIKARSSGKNVFLLVSGGVDSTVCFALLNELLGPKRVLGLHIDNGFMRKDESKNVCKAMAKHGFSNLNVVDASEGFLESVKGVINPEKKRAIIGEYFIKVYRDEVKKLNLNPKKWLLAQGTIYPDTIETGGTKHAALIKTHHNRVPLLQRMIKQGLVLEPISQLYKDEVRLLGKLLGLPSKLIDRHPFPGPGLSVRCLCSDGREKVNPKTSRKLNSELRGTGMKGVVAPIKSVGVQGDFRTYRNPAIIEAKNINYDRLETVGTGLTNKISGINRAMLLLAGKSNMKLKKATLTKERLDLLREVDAIVVKILRKQKLYAKVWQMPVVLVPYGMKNGESIVLRPIDSTEAMTARFYRFPKKVINEMKKELMKLPIDGLFLDITNKPPGTIEWE